MTGQADVRCCQHRLQRRGGHPQRGEGISGGFALSGSLEPALRALELVGSLEPALQLWCLLAPLSRPCLLRRLLAPSEPALLALELVGSLRHSSPAPSWVAATDTGRQVTKEAVVSSIRAVASLLGLPLEDRHNRSLYTGHALRVGGAQYLSSVLMIWVAPVYYKPADSVEPEN